MPNCRDGTSPACTSRAATAKLEALGRTGFGVGYEMAQVHAALGDEPAALAALERGLRDSS